MSGWAATMNAGTAATAGLLRLHKGVEACQVDATLWLRGDTLDEPTHKVLRKVAPDALYELLAQGELVLLGHRVPIGRLPDGPWISLSQWMIPEIQASLLPGQLPIQTAIRLVSGGKVREPRVLLTPWHVWADYAQTAPAIRLKPLRFAADASRAFLWGSPLPPLPGRYFNEEYGIAVPCGWTVDPAIAMPILRTRMGLGEAALALLAQDGSYECIPAEAFVPARRSAVRLTGQGAEHASA